MAFKDHFSQHAASYAAARPDYPAELFTYLAELCSQRGLAWDCATGNGQAARALASHFARVIATDASKEQIAAATPADGIEYLVAPAEASPLSRHSADLITVAQALHWFDLEGFYNSVDRVLMPGGIVAVWSYGINRVTPAMDRVISVLYEDILGKYWPPERRLVEQGYADIRLPFESIEPPPFEMRREWTLEALKDYLRSWSSTQRYLREHGVDPLAQLEAEFSDAWGEVERRPVVWPLALKVSRRPLAG